MPSDAEAQAARVDVAEFSIDEVKEILTAARFDPTRFAERQLKVLQLPQNLSLFLDAEFDASRPPPFRTATEIFDRYWDAKRRSMAERVAPAPDDHWMGVIETLSDEMTRTQQLSVRRETLDAFPRDYVHQLASEGVLARDGRRYAFGHESFLDYAFARVFVRRTEPLVSFLKASEQHLFRRAQVRQVLAYLRERRPAAVRGGTAPPARRRGYPAAPQGPRVRPPGRSPRPDGGGVDDLAVLDHTGPQHHRGRHAEPQPDFADRLATVLRIAVLVRRGRPARRDRGLADFPERPNHRQRGRELSAAAPAQCARPRRRPARTVRRTAARGCRGFGTSRSGPSSIRADASSTCFFVSWTMAPSTTPVHGSPKTARSGACSTG